jgi:hypothetical protein
VRIFAGCIQFVMVVRVLDRADTQTTIGELTDKIHH